MKNEIIEEIKKEFYLIDSLQKKAKFQCYSDNIATYHLKEDDGSFHELCIINDHTTFFRKEKIIDLLNLENTFYLSHRYFAKLDPVSKNQFELIIDRTFRVIDVDE